MTTVTLPAGAEMLALAAAAARDLRADVHRSSGSPTMEELAIHRATVDRLTDPAGPLEQFNALARWTGHPTVDMGTGLWPAVHVDLVTRMVETAVAAAAAV